MDFQYKGSYIVCSKPGWLVVEDKLYHFKKSVDGNKLKPFLNKKFIVIPAAMEDAYYEKFIAPLIESFDVYAKGFDIVTDTFDPRPVLTITDVASDNNLTLFEGSSRPVAEVADLLLELTFEYGQYNFKADQSNPVSVQLEKKDDKYIFHRVKKKLDSEKFTVNQLRSNGLPIKTSRITMKQGLRLSMDKRPDRMYPTTES